MFTASAAGGFFSCMAKQIISIFPKSISLSSLWRSVLAKTPLSRAARGVITLSTDFGDGFATSQLKAVVIGLGYEGQLIENHYVKPFSIVEGAYGIWQLAKLCPVGTVHVGVVDPGVGSGRAGIVIKTKNCWFVGPDNGLLWPAAALDGIRSVWKIEEGEFGEIANTFHGRDVFIKQAVYLAQEGRPRGKRVDHVERLEFKEGQVVHIDTYGNAKIWGKKTFGLPIVKTFSDVSEGEPLLLNGSSDLLELAVNCGSAEARFGLKLGQVLNKL